MLKSIVQLKYVTSSVANEVKRGLESGARASLEQAEAWRRDVTKAYDDAVCELKITDLRAGRTGPKRPTRGAVRFLKHGKWDEQALLATLQDEILKLDLVVSRTDLTSVMVWALQKFARRLEDLEEKARVWRAAAVLCSLSAEAPVGDSMARVEQVRRGSIVIFHEGCRKMLTWNSSRSLLLDSGGGCVYAWDWHWVAHVASFLPLASRIWTGCHFRMRFTFGRSLQLICSAGSFELFEALRVLERLGHEWLRVDGHLPVDLVNIVQNYLFTKQELSLHYFILSCRDFSRHKQAACF
jgi:hypothetical protein